VWLEFFVDLLGQSVLSICVNRVFCRCVCLGVLSMCVVRGLCGFVGLECFFSICVVRVYYRIF
jgi:hypothetical protein